MVETSCYRDLTRKTKIKGLTSTSCLNHFRFYSLVFGFILTYCDRFSLLLFLHFRIFDEDIYQIILQNYRYRKTNIMLKVKNGNEYFYLFKRT